MNGPLSGRGILLTRPAHQSERSLAALRDAGARVWHLPALQIEAFASEDLDATLSRYAAADIAIFVSANAAEFGLAALAQRGIAATGPRIAAIGQATRTMLASHGVNTDILSSQGEDSESLLAHPAFSAVRERTVIIFRGLSAAGGRTVLRDTLVTRGANVIDAVCYARNPARHDPAVVDRIQLTLASGRCHAVQAMSAESLDALLLTLGRTEALLQCLLLVPHPRIAAAATERGFREVHVADLGDDAIVHSVAAALSTLP